MKKLVLASLALAGVVMLADSAEAFGHRHRGCDQGCASACDECGGGACGGCGMTVSYQSQQVTCYRPEWHERKVEVTVNRLVQREVTENQTVTECVPVWTTQEQTETTYQMHAREVVSHVTVCVPVWTTQKQMQTTYSMVPEQVMHTVCCTRMVQTCCVDPCTGCSHVVCRPETYTQQVPCTVMRCVPQQHEVNVQVCSMQQQSREVRSTVQECVPVQHKVNVQVCSYQQKTRNVAVKRLVCEWQPTKEARTESYCTMVAYQKTIQVPVCTPAPTCSTCASAAPVGCGSCGGCQ